MRPALLLILAALLCLPLPGSPPTASAAAPSCQVQEGRAVGPVALGISLADMLRLLGSPSGQVAGGQRGEVTYQFTGTVTQVTVLENRVLRIATNHAACTTTQGIRVGATEAGVAAAYARAVGSVRGESRGFVRLVYPFTGVEFVLSGGRVVLIEVFRAEALPVALAPAATPTPAPGGAANVVIRTLSARLEGATLVVSGTVANSGAPVALYVEIIVLEGSRRVAETTTPLYPNPVGAGRTGSFQERLSVSEVFDRVVVRARPMNRPTVVLAEAVQEIKDKDVAQFTGMADQLIDVTVLGAAADRASGTMVSITNRSPLRITGLVIAIEMSTTCRVQSIPPPPAPPAPVAQTFSDTRRGTVRVPVLEPNSRVEVAIDLEGRGPCLGFGPPWSAQWRVVSANVEAPPK